jgi:hypothetical protein
MFLSKGDPKIARARNELVRAIKAPNKIRRPFWAKMSLKRKLEKLKSPPATMSGMVNALVKATRGCNRERSFGKYFFQGRIVTRLIPASNAITEIQESQSRSRPGNNTRAPRQRKKSALQAVPSATGGFLPAAKWISVGTIPVTIPGPRRRLRPPLRDPPDLPQNLARLVSAAPGGLRSQNATRPTSKYKRA